MTLRDVRKCRKGLSVALIFIIEHNPHFCLARSILALAISWMSFQSLRAAKASGKNALCPTKRRSFSFHLLCTKERTDELRFLSQSKVEFINSILQRGEKGLTPFMHSNFCSFVSGS